MQLRRVAELLHQDRAYRLKVREHADAVLVQNEAGYKVKRLEEEARALGEVLGRVYTDQGEAERKLVEYGRQFGTGLTRMAFSVSPQEFGTLRKTDGWRRLRVAWAEAPAREAARDGAERVATAVGHYDELNAARKHLAELIEAVRAARAAKDAFSGAHAPEREITAALRSMLAQAPPWWVRQQLARLVPPDDYEAAGIANRAYQAACEPVRGRELRRSGYEIS